MQQLYDSVLYLYKPQNMEFAAGLLCVLGTEL